MSTNAPPFDPINPTPEEEEAMTAGYLAAIRGYIEPPDGAYAFAHGYRMGRNDRAGVSDDDQSILAQRQVAKLRGLPDPYPPALAQTGTRKTEE